VAFTGDTSADFITHPGNEDVLRARLLIMVRPLRLLQLTRSVWEIHCGHGWSCHTRGIYCTL